MNSFNISSYVNNSATNALQSISSSVFQQAMSSYNWDAVNSVETATKKKETAASHSEKLTPNRILKSGNRTIVFWSDGTKTIVKRAEDEPDNDYAAFTAALGIKIFGSNSALRRMIKKSVKVQEKKEKTVDILTEKQ